MRINITVEVVEPRKIFRAFSLGKTHLVQSRSQNNIRDTTAALELDETQCDCTFGSLDIKAEDGRKEKQCANKRVNNEDEGYAFRTLNRLVLLVGYIKY